MDVSEPSLWTKRTLYDASEPLDAIELDTSKPHATLHANFILASLSFFPFGEIFPKEKGETMSKSNFDSCEGSESGAKAEEGE